MSLEYSVMLPDHKRERLAASRENRLPLRRFKGLVLR
jgi:hypothetical protein